MYRKYRLYIKILDIFENIAMFSNPAAADNFYTLPPTD